MVRAYKLYSSVVTTGSASATIQIPRNGTILGCQWSIAATGGAGVDGRLSVELSTSSVTTATTNDTPGNSLSQAGVSNNIASSAAVQNLYTPIGVAINAGDKLYIHTLAVGTAYGSGNISCVVFVNH